MGSAADALNVFRSFLGIAENPNGSNQTPIGEEYGWNGVAWCDETVSVVLRRIGLPPGPIDSAHFASCWFHNQAYKRGECGTWVGGNISDVQPGDQIFFGTSGSDHTGMVEAVHPESNAVTTLEGNIGNAVRREWRQVGGSMHIHGFGRPRYDGSAAPDLPPPSATAGRPILRAGNTGEGVKNLQNFLNTFYKADLTVDGDFGPATDAAVKSFQGANGLVVDGEFGPASWGKLDQVIAWCAAQVAPAAAPASAPPFPGTTKLGSHGNAVRAVQQRLRDRGWRVAVDGVFGPATKNVVETYQREKGLGVDGVAGPQTWVSLWTAPL
jgi:peptidoglycan hydrolase-like protein with peptidoglycan-binding domain